MLRKLIAVASAVVFGASLSFAASEKSLHDFTVESIELNEMDLAQYRGKTVLLVNTASFCGYTPQYKGLQALYDGMKDDGFVVLGVPSNDFGGQEPDSEANVKKFCEATYNVKFPMTSKMVVNGEPGTADLYEWLADELGDESRPQWNFHKYLIGPDGQPVAFFPSRVTPESKELLKEIKSAMASAG